MSMVKAQHLSDNGCPVAAELRERIVESSLCWNHTSFFDVYGITSIDAFGGIAEEELISNFKNYILRNDDSENDNEAGIV